MLIEEIEVPIKGTPEEIEKKLLANGFEIFYKVITISSYYLPKNETTEDHLTLKERCKRIRYVEPMSKFKNDWQNYKKWIVKYNINKCKKKEQDLLNSGYRLIYTDEKTDFVYKNINAEKMYFQIQNIKDDCLIVAYDNEKYYGLEKEEQRRLLIEDVKRYGIEILDEKNIDRFKLIGKTLTVEEIINKMNMQIKLL